MRSSRLPSFAAALLTLLVKQAHTQTNRINTVNCSGNAGLDGPPNQNATGSYIRPNPYWNDDWIYNIAVTIDHNEQVWQKFWIDTPRSPGNNQTDLPSTLCLTAMPHLPRNVSFSGQNDTGDCVATLGQNCVAAINTIIAPEHTTASAKGCKDLSSQVFGGAIKECGPSGLGGSTLMSGSPASSGTACRNGQNFTAHVVFGAGTGDKHCDDCSFDQTDYDEAVYNVVPFLASYVVGEGSPNPALKSELICMRTKNVTEGSRVPPPMPAVADSSGRRLVVSGGILGATLIAMVMVLG